MNIAVLASGGGTNLQALIDNEKSLGPSFCPYYISCVFCDKKSSYALQRAEKAQISSEVVSPYAIMGSEIAKNASQSEKRLAVSNRCLELCTSYNIDAVVLAGFLTVLAGPFLDKYSGRIINIHPALLPKFGGEGMWGNNVHRAVLAAQEKESGCTIHLVDHGCDTGRILLQKKVPVLADDTVESLYARIAIEEHKAIVEGVTLLANELYY
ncbi:MAG TPA: phosphoribosylglycinamide formyltransferase [Treponemataceae bacterium]|nr:phosphoribosylglycinamide formyltransferase [Treponemataceae bacterium]